MRKIFHGLMAAVVLATGSVSFTPQEAAAQSIREQQRFVERYCARNPRDRDCREFRRDARRWDRRRYQRWYRENRRNDREFNAAAVIFGLAAGAIAGGAIAGSNNGSGVRGVSRESVARCAQRYRTYDPRTHTYVANSRGDRVVCRL